MDTKPYRGKALCLISIGIIGRAALKRITWYLNSSIKPVCYWISVQLSRMHNKMANTEFNEFIIWHLTPELFNQTKVTRKSQLLLTHVSMYPPCTLHCIMTGIYMYNHEYTCTIIVQYIWWALNVNVFFAVQFFQTTFAQLEEKNYPYQQLLGKRT